MNIAPKKRESQANEKKRLLAAIERLWRGGYSTYEIAEALNEEPHVVGRNLREIRKRCVKTAARFLSRQRANTVARYEPFSAKHLKAGTARRLRPQPRPKPKRARKFENSFVARPGPA